jgi:(E)-4-hydroxy-3-methylbut-2-enyl-diphosphate synthase
VIKTVELLEQRLAHISEPISLSIIGCVVNGPGEAALTDQGFTGGGKESGKMFVSGRPDHNVSNADMVEHIVGLVEQKAEAMRRAREAAEVAAE